MKNQAVITDVNQCNRIGQILNNIDIRPAFYKREYLSLRTSLESKVRVYLFSAAICHQTRNLYHSELDLWGWDFMELAFVNMSQSVHPLLNTGTSSFTVHEIKSFLREAFSINNNLETCTLDRLNERAEMLFEILSDINLNYNRSAVNLIKSTNNKLIDNGIGLYEKLGNYKAFCDPRKKKITFFLKLVQDAGLFHVTDEDHLIPIMDYHMQRVLLRMGCVEVNDVSLQESLQSKSPQSSDDQIRTACIKAIRIIANISGNQALKMNDIFWPIGRSCCHETTLCTDHKCSKDPCTFYLMADLNSHESCIFESSCKGSSNEKYRKLWEPMVVTHYY